MNDYLKELFIDEAKKALESKKSDGITPTGDINITENGEFDVTEFAKAIVNVASGGGEEEASLLDSLIDRSITEISSNVTIIGDGAFYKCTLLTTANFQNATSVQYTAFYNCYTLATVNIPNVVTIASTAFYGCKALKTLDLPSVTSIGNSAFNDTGLKALILRSPTTCSLSSSISFVSTPIKNGTGYIYVPSALIEEYKTNTKWLTFAAQFRALEDYTVDGTITGELDESKI